MQIGKAARELLVSFGARCAQEQHTQGGHFDIVSFENCLRFHDGIELVLPKEVRIDMPAADVAKTVVEGSVIEFTNKTLAEVARYGCVLLGDSLNMKSLSVTSTEVASLACSVRSGDFLNYRGAFSNAALGVRVCDGIATSAALIADVFGVLLDVEFNETIVSLTLRGEDNLFRMEGSWSNGCLNGTTSGLLNVPSGSYGLNCNWVRGRLVSMALFPKRNGPPKTEVRLAAGRLRFICGQSVFVADDFPSHSVALRGLLCVSRHVSSRLKMLCASVASVVLAKSLCDIRHSLDAAVRSGVGSRIKSAQMALAIFGAKQVIAAEKELATITQSRDETCRKLKELASQMKKKQIEREAECVAIRNSSFSLEKIEEASIAIRDMGGSSWDSERDFLLRSQQLDAARANLLMKIGSVEKEIATEAFSSSELSKLSSECDELAMVRYHQALSLKDLEDSSVPFGFKDAGISTLQSRIADLRNQVSDARMRSTQLTLASVTLEKDSPSPHCSLRMKVARSSIRQLESEISVLETRRSGVLMKLNESRTGIALASKSCEREVDDELSLLKEDVLALEVQETTSSEKVDAAMGRHQRSLDNFRQRTQAIEAQLKEISVDMRLIHEKAQSNGRAQTLHSAYLEKARLMQTIEGIKQALAIATPYEEPLPDLQGMRDQILEVKRLGKVIEDENLELSAEIRSLGDRQREREHRLVASKVADGDTRVAILQKEVERRDAVIARLRSEIQRVRQLEAKLLTTKASVSVQKHASLHSAQLAAAVSAAQSKTEDALWFARTAGRHVSKGL